MPTDRMDPRCTRSRQRVLAAAVDVLREDGLPGLTFEAVASRSGVAKTTIYRHFADRESLHLAAIESVGPRVEMPCSDDVVADLTSYLEAVNRMLHHSDFGAILLTGLDASERSSRMGSMARDIGRARRAVVIGRLRMEQDAGRLDPEVELDVVCDQLVGPLFYRRFMSRTATPAGYAGALVARVLTPLATPSPGAASATGGGRPRSARSG